MSADEYFDYEDDRAVYLVDDGERHWYVATDMAKALAAHLGLMEPEADEYTVKKLAPSEPVTLFLEDRRDAERLAQPPFALLPRVDEDDYWKVSAPSAVWAMHTEAGEQICSSCFL